MTPDKAQKVLNEIRSICEKNGLWFSVTSEMKPDLKMIRINEISIQIDKGRS